MSAVAESIRTAAAAPSAEQQLAELREAWRTKLRSESTLARLRTYSHRTAGMKADADRAVRQLMEADATIKRVLGGAA